MKIEELNLYMPFETSKILFIEDKIENPFQSMFFFEEFENVLKNNSIQIIDYDYIINLFNNKELIDKYPKTILNFIKKVIGIPEIISISSKGFIQFGMGKEVEFSFDRLSTGTKFGIGFILFLILNKDKENETFYINCLEGVLHTLSILNLCSFFIQSAEYFKSNLLIKLLKISFEQIESFEDNVDFIKNKSILVESENENVLINWINSTL